MKNILEAAFHPLDFLNGDKDIQSAVGYFNEFLKFDGYQLIAIGNKWKVSQLVDTQIDLSHPYENSVEITHIFLMNKLKNATKN
ncbi:hypothetical protein [Dolichospermum flos-aquae]|uniref:hypothetical protein n=1 Tax=Dolichospermum flosaquae TaxID=1166 RepID=UPI001D1363F4|nr:hypothetical protein [Dolichospermum flos-aquae]